MKRILVTVFIVLFSSSAHCNLWAELQRNDNLNLNEFTRLCGEWTVCRAYLEDTNAKITVFAPVDEVFAYNPRLLGMDQKMLLSHIVDVQMPQPQQDKKWKNETTLIRSAVNQGNVYVTQFENGKNNFSYYANNAMACNHASSSWAIISGEQYLYKMCTPMGHRGFPGPALSFIRMSTEHYFTDRLYNNHELTVLRDILERVPDVALVIYGSSTWNGFHTFFLPNNHAFMKVDRLRVDRDVLLAHVTGQNTVLFCYPWLYDGGIHYYPTVQFTSTVIQDNVKLKVAMRNITNRKTGKYDLYAVSEVYQQYGRFRRGSVWAKIVTPNIPLTNGVAHVVDSVLGIVSNSIDQLLNENHQCTTLLNYINRIGILIRKYFSANQGTVTFFAPINEAFDRIPQSVERRLLRDRMWLEQVLKLHIAPGKDLTSDEINNRTILQTVDPRRRLFFIKGEWPRNNITYYVIGGGVQATIRMDNVAALNGIIHYVDRVLGVPYENMYQIVRNHTHLQQTDKFLSRTQLRYSLDPWEVIRPEQNFTFFVPTDTAWLKVPAYLRDEFLSGRRTQALQYVLRRHLIQGQALMYTDLRERTYVMMNNDKVAIRRWGNYFEMWWPYGNMVSRLIEGGEVAAINGFMHQIDTVLILPQDIHAGCLHLHSLNWAVIVVGIYYLIYGKNIL